MAGKKWSIYLLTGKIQVISVNSTGHFRTLESKSLLIKIPKGIEPNRITVATCKGHSKGLLSETGSEGYKRTSQAYFPFGSQCRNIHTEKQRAPASWYNFTPAFCQGFFPGITEILSSFIHSLNWYLLCTYYMLGTIPDDTAVKWTDEVLALTEHMF